jgi:hypothetical protein
MGFTASILVRLLSVLGGRPASGLRLRLSQDMRT